MDKKNRVLILIDVQNDFISGSLANKDAQKVVPNIVQKIKNFDGDLIILTQDTHFENYLETKEGKKLPVEHCIYKTKGWEISEDVRHAINVFLDCHVGEDKRVITVKKPTFGSMLPVHHVCMENADYLDLIDVLNNICLIEQTDNLDIELCGLLTDICVISNALLLKSWFYDSAEISVDSKCCAGVTPESHEAALTVMKNCQINVI